MARLEFRNPNRSTTDMTLIREELSSLGIELSQWTLPEDQMIRSLLAKETLTDAEKIQVLDRLDYRFDEQKEKYGYQSRDLIVLHKDVPNLDGLLSQFDKVHIHADDEVRYIVDGSGCFGFLRPDGSQVVLTVEAQEYIRVPKNTKHWFVLNKDRRIKAVRYFTSKEGWVAQYTGDQVQTS